MIIISPILPTLSWRSIISFLAVMRSPTLTGWKYSQSLPPSNNLVKGRSNGNSGLSIRMDLKKVGGAIKPPYLLFLAVTSSVQRGLLSPIASANFMMAPFSTSIVRGLLCVPIACSRISAVKKEGGVVTFCTYTNAKKVYSSGRTVSRKPLVEPNGFDQ